MNSSILRVVAWLLGVLLLCLSGCSVDIDVDLEDSASEASESSQTVLVPKTPNILLIVADDLGYTDLGAFGGELATPVLDTLARAGTRFTNFHTAPSCAPTRAMLLTGMDNHQAGMGSQSGLETPLQAQTAAYQNRLSPKVPTIAEQLSALGYRTLASAKWHLGAEPETLPGARGFDRSFVLMEGGGGHFDDTPLLERYGRAHWFEDDEPFVLPAEFYSTDFMTDKLLHYIGETPVDQPFFAYLGYTAPHWPLQAPEADIKKQAGNYDAGWDRLREQRMAGARREGVVADGAVAVASEPGSKSWTSIDASAQQFASRKMEVYAAMVERLDNNVGRVLEALRQSGRLDNTLILFTADNGAEAHPMEVYPQIAQWVVNTFDNSFENIGASNSYATLGPSWARATAAPFRDSKSKIAEGGIRVPAFVSLPKGLRAASIAENIDSSYMRVMDLAPTFIELAGGEPPRDMEGRSLLSRWQGSESPYSDTEIIASETYGRRAARRGPWKALLQGPPYGTGEWQLYNLQADLGEQNDLAQVHPELLAELVEGWQAYAQRVGVLLPETPILY